MTYIHSWQLIGLVAAFVIAVILKSDYSRNKKK